MIQREVVRCRSCRLNQFMTQTGLCRKCRQSLLDEPAPEPEIITTPASVREDALIDIAFAIKIIRQAYGMSQSELADKVGTHRGHISRFEGGYKEPNLKTLERLAEGFNMPLGRLLDFAQACCGHNPQRG